MYQHNILDEIIVDHFAGGGGASVGIEMALGRPVDIAINHDPDAIAMHQVNHPYTQHYCESVWDVDPAAVCAGRKVGLMHLSPDCKHFSRAKGSKPVDKNIRGLAWIALRWAGTVRPRVIILENVEEFQTWGPVRRHKPIKSRQGETFRKFVGQLRDLGYAVEWKLLSACDYGAPTIRRRLFLIARCDGQPIVFPTPTHGRGKGLKPYHTAAECIDWTISCPSIFDRSKPLRDNTLRRIARGLKKFVIENPTPYILQMNYDNAPQDVSAPLTTVTTVGHHFIVNPTIVPVGYGEHSGQNPRVNDSGEPLTTIVGTHKHYVAAPYLTKFQETSVGQTVQRPLDTVMAGAEAKRKEMEERRKWNTRD